MDGFIRVTSHADNTSMHIRASTVNAVYLSNETRRTFHGNEVTTPGQTVVASTAGNFIVTETVPHVVSKIAKIHSTPTN